MEFPNSSLWASGAVPSLNRESKVCSRLVRVLRTFSRSHWKQKACYGSEYLIPGSVLLNFLYLGLHEYEYIFCHPWTELDSFRQGQHLAGQGEDRPFSWVTSVLPTALHGWRAHLVSVYLANSAQRETMSAQVCWMEWIDFGASGENVVLGLVFEALRGMLIGIHLVVQHSACRSRCNSLCLDNLRHWSKHQSLGAEILCDSLRGSIPAPEDPARWLRRVWGGGVYDWYGRSKICSEIPATCQSQTTR